VHSFNSLFEEYAKIKPIILNRLAEFDRVWIEKDHYTIFQEFVFCLLTPQSKAKNAWRAVIEMTKNGVLYTGSSKDIEPYLKGVRFYKNKATYIVKARDEFFVNGRFLLLDQINEKEPKKTRDFLVKKVKGYGYKEASHFMRNIGLYRSIAILDRHIMRNMVRYGYLSEIPKTLTRKRYLNIEEKFFEFAKALNIPPEHLDLLLWYKEAGEVFK